MKVKFMEVVLTMFITLFLAFIIFEDVNLIDAFIRSLLGMIIFIAIAVIVMIMIMILKNKIVITIISGLLLIATIKYIL